MSIIGRGLVVAFALVTSGAFAAQQLVPTKTLLVKNPPSGKLKVLWKVKEMASPASVNGDPTADGATLRVVLTSGGDQCVDMPASGWSAIATLGYRYKDPTLANGPVKVAFIKKTPSGTLLLKALLLNGGPTPIGVAPGGPTTSYATNFRLGVGDEYCGGTGGATPSPNDAITFKVSNDGAPGGCVAACTPPSPSTSSTSSTSTSSTTSTTNNDPCCNGQGFIGVSTFDAPGDCGDIVDSGGMVTANVVCGGYYSGGGGNSVPLPYQAPDLTTFIASIASCAGPIANVAGATAGQTGSSRNCTSAGCRFGAPVPIPNALSTPTSTCVVNVVQGLSGTWDCSTGAADIAMPLGAIVYLTGDIATDPMGTIAGIQPCPLCSSGTCIGGDDNGMACVPGSSSMGGNPAYPTSHDCAPASGLNVGTLPIAFRLSTGTVSWTGTVATNDTGSTASVQSRVFSGYCRDANGTNSFQNPFQHCWENGIAIGAACAGVYESCEQRINGAFGPNGGGTNTITVIGSGAGLLGGSAPATLASVFSIPPTFNATVDASHDFPAPGAVSLPGTSFICAAANPCP